MSIAFPTINGNSIIKRLDMRIVHNVAVTTSNINFKQLIGSYDVGRWEAEVTIKPLSHSEAKVFQAFLARLRGAENTFTLGDPLMKYSTTPSVQTSSVARSIRDTEIGIVNNSTFDIEAGSHFSVGGHLYVLGEGVTGNGGTQVADISPALKTVLSGNNVLDFQEPVGTWRMATNNTDWSISSSGFYSYTFSCVEAV